MNARTGARPAGAEINLYDPDGILVDSWSSSNNETHCRDGLFTGAEFTLHADCAPEGYLLPADTIFSLNADGSVDYDGSTTTDDEDNPVLLVEFEKTRVRFDAVDADGNRLEVAVMQILNADGDVVDEWTSGSEPYCLEGLTAGEEYTLRVSAVPEGYIPPDTEPVFYFEADGAVMSGGDEILPEDNGDVILPIRIDPTRTIINTVDAVTGDPVAGAALEVLDDEDGLVEAWESGCEAHEITRLAIGREYTLRMIEPAEGYLPAEDFSFVLDESDSLSVNVAMAKAEAALEVDLTADSDAAVNAGDEITFTATVRNAGNVSLSGGVGNCWVLDQDGNELIELEGCEFELEPDDTTAFTFTYQVTAEDFAYNDLLSFRLTAYAFAAYGDAPEDADAEVSVLLAVPQAVLEAELAADKTDSVTVGDEITFTATVRNAGDVAVEDVVIESSQADFSSDCFILAPGEEISVSFVYVVTEDDVYAGEIVGEVTVSGMAVRGDDPADAEAQVTVTTVSVCSIFGHDWGKWEETMEPGCTELGEETRICARCGETETQPVAALGHHYDAVVNDPTCTEGGCTVYTCSRCGDSYEDDYTNALGHDWSEWMRTIEPTESEPGEEIRVCANCGETETRPVGLFPDDPITILQQPADVAVPLGEIASTTVIAEGEGLTYQWYGREANGREFKSSLKGDTYSVALVKSKIGRTVWCVITDAEGNSVTTREAILSVAYPEDYEAPTVTVDEVNTSAKVSPGETAFVTVAATGYGALHYQWYIQNKGSESRSRSNIKGPDAAIYSVAMTAARDGRTVWCVVTDAWGNSATSEPVTIGYDRPAGYERPTVTVSEGDIHTDVDAGELASVTVTAAGPNGDADGLHYQWYLRADENAPWSRSSLKGDTYSVKMVPSKSGRQVKCVVTDAYGKKTESAVFTLTMVIPTEYHGPSITGQPGSVTVARGEIAATTVAADGEGLTYQWYGREANGRTFRSGLTGPTYSVAMVPSKSGRQVWCVVTDKYGRTVTSDVATLAMAP